MKDHFIHTEETAPAGSKDLLRAVEEKFGYLPNILGAMAESPAALEGYLALSKIFDKSSLTPAERQLILLTISRENECHFCVAAHSGGSKKAGADLQTIEAARDGMAVTDPRLNALLDFTTALTVNRGHVTEEQMQAFLDAGFGMQQAFEIILGIAVKVLTNYVDAVGNVPLNDHLTPLKWVPPSQRAAE